jgi:hypothetical protein
MIQQIKIKIARWLLGKHCPCYRMGYHHMTDYKQRCAENLAKEKKLKMGSS